VQHIAQRRAHAAPRHFYRVFFCIQGSDMVLLHGFMKKTQATPQREIEVARERRRTLRSRA
jgi:phage-related protein